MPPLCMALGYSYFKKLTDPIYSSQIIKRFTLYVISYPPV